MSTLKPCPDPRQVVLLSVPYCEPLPLVAPALLASCLEQAGIGAKGIDFNIDFIKQFSNESWFTEYKNFLTMGHLVHPIFPKAMYRQILNWTRKYIGHLVATHSPNTIGLSIFTTESLDFGLVMSAVIRQSWPKIKVIAGGKGLEIHCDGDKKHYERWIEHGIADLIVVGDAESAVVEAIKHDHQGLFFATPQTKEDLDLIPLAQWDDYDMSAYAKVQTSYPDYHTEPYLTVTASKGCVRKCTFCDVASFWPEYLYRDPVKVAREMIFNYRKTGISTFAFTDNLINGSISNFREINQVLVREIPNTIRYRGYAIFRGKNQMPEDDFRLAAQAGCYLWNIGIESGSEKVRYDMKKKFSNDDLDWSVRMLHRYGIKQNWLLIVGYPSETEKDFEDTKKLLTRYQHLNGGGAIGIQITPTFMLLGNSPLLMDHTLAQKYGLEHVKEQGPYMNKFWTSTRYLDNDYPTRSRRWKELVVLAQDLGYPFRHSMPLQKWKDELEHFDKIYAEQKTKVINIHPQ